MKNLKKVISGILAVGLLSTAMSGLALADNAVGDTVGERSLIQGNRQGGRGGAILNSEQLTAKISTLSTEQQAAILALQNQLQTLMAEERTALGLETPMPERVAMTNEQKAAMETSRTQMKALQEEIEAVFTAAGITLPQPVAPSHENGGTPPEKLTEKAGKDGQAPWTEQLSQLSAKDQAQVAELQTQMQALMEAERTAMGEDHQEGAKKAALTDEQKATMASYRTQIEAAQKALTDALSAAGVALQSQGMPRGSGASAETI